MLSFDMFPLPLDCTLVKKLFVAKINKKEYWISFSEKFSFLSRKEVKEFFPLETKIVEQVMCKKCLKSIIKKDGMLNLPRLNEVEDFYIKIKDTETKKSLLFMLYADKAKILKEELKNNNKLFKKIEDKINRNILYNFFEEEEETCLECFE